MMEMMVALYYHFMNIDPEHPKKEDRDIFILSKGHAGVGLCTVLGDRGFFPEEDLDNFNQTGSPFGVHPDHKKIPGVEASTICRREPTVSPSAAAARSEIAASIGCRPACGQCPSTIAACLSMSW